MTALCGGEALPEDLARDLAPRVRALWNMYVPTETTIWSMLARITPQGPVTVGAPIDHTYVRVLDRRARPVPAGWPGELCIGGDGAAVGYHQRPDLTAERFIPDPGEPGEPDEPARILYRTGDIGRFLPDGALGCLGRADHQIKLNGYRIELGEIDAALRA